MVYVLLVAPDITVPVSEILVALYHWYVDTFVPVTENVTAVPCFTHISFGEVVPNQTAYNIHFAPKN